MDAPLNPEMHTASDIGEVSDRAKISIPVNNQPSFTPRKLRAIIIGAGYSSLTLVHKLRHQHPEMEDILTYKLFEARSDIGGTWLVNTYPGVQCDVPAHIYVCHGIQRTITHYSSLSVY
jgi:cation diffusion facilitator CzcD-associated flavoprotein CzcO